MIDVVKLERKKLEEWASHNALTLIFLSFMFFITWGVIFFVNIVF